MSSKLLYELREVSFWMYGEENYTIEIDGEPELYQEFKNPLEAWTCFADVIDLQVRKHMKELSSLRGELYRVREVSLFCTGEGVFIIEVDTETEPYGPFRTLLEAWVIFINVLDSRVRRRIGDMLEKQGRNRYTGELIDGEK